MMPPPRCGDRKAHPDGRCSLWYCGLDHKVAPSIVDCVASRSLAERIRASHQLMVGAK